VTLTNLDQLTQWRQQLHAIPEFGFEEVKTSAFVAERLRAMPEMQVTTGIGRTGLVGVLEGKRAGGGRTIAFRADMDALKIAEKTGLSYASTHAGRMHACGHDGHTTLLLGAARELSANPDFAGRIVFLFQPAEEHGKGARAMIADGVIQRFGIQEAYGIHNMPRLAVGHFGSRVGPIMASEDNFEIRIKGKGAHAARPQWSRDPIVTGAQIVLALQTIVSRRTDPLENSVVSVTEFITDGQVNVLPENVTLKGDTRSYLPAVQKMIEEEMRAQATGIGAAFSSLVEVDYSHVFSSTVNHERETGYAAAAARIALGEAAVDLTYPPMMGSEDFGLFLEHVPGNFAYLGNGTDGRHAEPLHNAHYDFNDAAIAPGVAYWCALARGRLGAASS
jgi:amidohydrolase